MQKDLIVMISRDEGHDIYLLPPDSMSGEKARDFVDYTIIETNKEYGVDLEGEATGVMLGRLISSGFQVLTPINSSVCYD